MRTPVVTGVVVVVVLTGAAMLLVRDTTTTLDPADLESIFVGEVGTQPGEPGIYRYSTTGHEAIDALQGARHEYPDETVMTISDDECGPVVRWHALRERWIEWEHCGPDLGITMTTEHHEWFGIPDDERETCPVPRPVMASGSSIECAAGDLVETYEVEFLGTMAVDIGGAVVEAIGVRRESTLSGESSGSTTAEVWRLAGTALILSMDLASTSVTPSAAGDVTYKEELRLDLVDIGPAGTADESSSNPSG